MSNAEIRRGGVLLVKTRRYNKFIGGIGLLGWYIVFSFFRNYIPETNLIPETIFSKN